MPNRTINIPCVGATLPLPPAVPALCFLGLMALLLAAVAAGRVKGYWLGCPRSLYYTRPGSAMAPPLLRGGSVDAGRTLRARYAFIGGNAAFLRAYYVIIRCFSAVAPRLLRACSAKHSRA